jgi:hypothetical protein
MVVTNNNGVLDWKIEFIDYSLYNLSYSQDIRITNNGSSAEPFFLDSVGLTQFWLDALHFDLIWSDLHSDWTQSLLWSATPSLSLMLRQESTRKVIIL